MWDEKYSESEYIFGTVPNDFLRSEYARIAKGGRILCLADGEGRNSVFLAMQGYLVTAVDQSSVGLKKANELARLNGVEIQTEVADLGNFDLGQEWDGVVSIFAHTPPAVRKQIHRVMKGALREGGVFILEAYTERQLGMDAVGGPPESQKELFMSLEGLESELGELDFAIGQEIERHVSEGKKHAGLSSVVQVVARKVKGD